MALPMIISVLVRLSKGVPLQMAFLIAKLESHNLQGEVSSGSTYKNQGLDEATIAKINALYGFDKPLLERYFLMLKNYIVFDFGDSFYKNTSVVNLILEKLPVSISLGLWSTLLIYRISRYVPLQSLTDLALL